MAGSSKQPLVTFIVPTLNSAAVLDNCLQSLRRQNLKDFEILVSDGGSADATRHIAQKFNCRIIDNPLRTAEAAKAVCVRFSRGKYLCFVDSDNILPESDWLQKMVAPLQADSSLIGSEPWEYTYRPKAGFIERWSSLTGVNDPYTLVAGNFDRKNYLRPTWTGIRLPQADFPRYIKITLPPGRTLPTIGANGTVFRTGILKKSLNSDYLFDIDVLESLLAKSPKPLFFAKVKVGIIHTYCEKSVRKFFRKQIRRATDLFLYRQFRTYSLTTDNTVPTVKFILYTLLILPMLADAFVGFLKKPDSAWFFHPLACIITLYAYSLVTLKYRLGVLAPVNRLRWQQ